MAHRYTVYIDEAGDDGFGKLRSTQGYGQSRWFVLGACCVKKEDDIKLVSWRDEIADAFPNRQTRDIHFKNLKHDQRRHACRVLGKKPIRVLAVFSNKVTLLDLPTDRLNTFKRKNHLYNYLCRWLLERVSLGLKTHAKANKFSDCRAKVVFSRRGGMNYAQFRDYLQLIKGGKEVIQSPGKIDWDVIDPDLVEAFDHDKRAGLQLADIATSALFQAVEPNKYGMVERSYAEELKSVVLRSHGSSSAYNSGITHVPIINKNTPLSEEQSNFFTNWVK